MTFTNIRIEGIDFFFNITIGINIDGVVEKVLFNHKVHKVVTKYTKVNPIFHPDSYRDFVTFV